MRYTYYGALIFHRSVVRIYYLIAPTESLALEESVKLNSFHQKAIMNAMLHENIL